MKKTYAAPRLICHGSVEALTKGLSIGSRLDAGFPVGTPVVDLTFS